jgi:hypothetical protein
MSLLDEQWMKSLSEVCLDPNGIYNKFRKPQKSDCFWSLKAALLRGEPPGKVSRAVCHTD